MNLRSRPLGFRGSVPVKCLLVTHSLSHTLPHFFVTVASQMGVVAVYALNAEMSTILREAKNGMVAPMTYALAKTVLVLPIMFTFAIFAMGIPSIAILDFPSNTFGKTILLWSAVMYSFETVAECLSVWVEDPILGLLSYMCFWFGAFLFGGFLVSYRFSALALT